MDPVQDNAAAQEPTASIDAPINDGTPATQPSEPIDGGEVEIVCIQAIQSRELGVIAEPGERRIIPHSNLDAFLATEAFQMLGPVVSAAGATVDSPQILTPAQGRLARLP